MARSHEDYLGEMMISLQEGAVERVLSEISPLHYLTKQVARTLVPKVHATADTKSLEVVTVAAAINQIPNHARVKEQKFLNAVLQMSSPPPRMLIHPPIRPQTFSALIASTT